MPDQTIRPVPFRDESQTSAATDFFATFEFAVESQPRGQADFFTMAKPPELRGRIDKAACTYNGIKLYGKVQVVDRGADIKVRRVNSSPDLKVKSVTAFADSCGEWQFVTSYPDFKVQFVENFADFTIKTVGAFPGVP